MNWIKRDIKKVGKCPGICAKKEKEEKVCLHIPEDLPVHKEIIVKYYHGNKVYREEGVPYNFCWGTADHILFIEEYKIKTRSDVFSEELCNL